jgi:D-threonate/D-erythronate kinase
VTDTTDHAGLRVGIYADDLTGALDAAAPFAAVGLSVYVSVFGVVPDEVAVEHRVLSLNIDTRHGDRFPVFDKAARAAKELRSAGFTLLVNKIDSTLRGHAGLEARAGLSPEPDNPGAVEEKGKWAGPRLALIAPSFPEMGRVVSDGQVFVNGELLADSEVGRDPLSPVTASAISELVHANTGITPTALNLSDVRAADQLDRRIRTLMSNPPTLLVCDAETGDDLTKIAAVAVRARGEIILSGSAGVTTALARYMSNSGLPVEHVARQNTGPTLIVSGSQRTVTGKQLELAIGSRNIEWVQLTPGELLEETTATEARNQAVAQLVGAIDSGRHAAVSLTQDAASDLVNQSNRTKLVRELGAICYRIARRTTPGSLMLIGGDTSQAALRALGAAGIVLHAEPLPGVPSGVVHGGLLDGVSIVTKAGAFGHDDVIVDVIDHLNQP